MKLNKKGFMMAEVIVVSAIVLSLLTTLYISYNKVFSLYQSRTEYEDVNLLYDLAYYRDVLIQKGNFDTALGDLYERQESGNSHDLLLTYYNYYQSYNSSAGANQELLGNDNVFMIYLKDGSINESKTDGQLTYKDYINYLNNSKEFTDTNCIMVLERCVDSKCKYAHIDLKRTF